MAAKRDSSTTIRGKVRPHDPFELIRWLALSQPDPRKAVAELVQNSLDAGAQSLRVTRARVRKIPCLRIFDDGEGVIPEVSRADALKYIATHIGHSRKRSLSPEARLQLMTQGQYGVGLLGFWSIGEQMEIRSAVPGQRPLRLVMYRDKPDYIVEPIRGRLPLEERWTEVLVSAVHRDALTLLGGRRLADYLAAELRGQLLAREVDLVIEDKMARGRAQKIVAVRPPRFLGERLEGLGSVEVPGYPDLQLELYVAAAAEERMGESTLAVYSAGTLVAENFHELSNIGLNHAPWTDTRLAGLVDFPGFRVTPGSRRSIVADAAAAAFALALASVEPIVEGFLAQLERRREEEADRTLVRDLQRAFRNFYRQQPGYAMLPIVEPVSGSAESGHVDAPEGEAVEALSADLEPAPDAPQAELLPAGPLHRVAITPPRVRVECRGSRRIRARPYDASGCPIRDGVRFEWTLVGPVGALEVASGDGHSALLNAADEPGTGKVSVIAIQGELRLRGEVAVEVVEEIESGKSHEGIPTPEFVHEPGAEWRSRMHDVRWEVNSGHREYRAIADRPALKLRYLTMLFAKEVVLRSHQDPRLERPLEQLVEVAGFADRNLASGRRSSRGRAKGDRVVNPSGASARDSDSGKR